MFLPGTRRPVEPRASPLVFLPKLPTLQSGRELAASTGAGGGTLAPSLMPPDPAPRARAPRPGRGSPPAPPPVLAIRHTQDGAQTDSTTYTIKRTIPRAPPLPPLASPSNPGRAPPPPPPQEASSQHQNRPPHTSGGGARRGWLELHQEWQDSHFTFSILPKDWRVPQTYCRHPKVPKGSWGRKDKNRPLISR